MWLSINIKRVNREFWESLSESHEDEKKGVDIWAIPTIEKHQQIEYVFSDVNYFITQSHGIKTSEKQILRGCYGTFIPGEFIAVMGPSGSGKTTLMRVLSGYPSEGERKGHGSGHIMGVASNGSTISDSIVSYLSISSHTPF